MKFARSAGCVFSGLMLAVTGAYAQEISNQATTQHVSSETKVSVTKSPVKKYKSVARKSAKPDVADLQAQREAAARAQAEQEERRRAEAAADAEARKQVESDAREKPLRDADALIKNGQPADAYVLLEPLEFERAGDVRFDYLLGIAALDSGKPDKATLVFERVLAVDPNFAGARLDMARAYYQLGDMPRAKTEFEIVQKQDLPDAARATIRKYLDAIAAPEAVKQTRITGYVEGALGHDNNVNAATGQSQVSIPALGNLVVTLSPDNVKAADNYFGLAAGGEVSHNLNAGWGVYAGADFRQRGNMTRTRFDSLGVDGRAGVMFGTEQDLFRVGVLGGQYTLGSLRNRDSLGFNAEWRHTFSPSNQLTVFGQHGRYRFVDPAMKTNDFDQSILGTGWLHVLADGKSALFGSVYHGAENDVAPVTLTNPAGGRVDGAKRVNGLRVWGQASLGEKTELFASLGWQEGAYNKTNPWFAPRKRSDRFSDLAVGANWHWDKLWTVRPQLSYSRNESNIAIYSFDRSDLSVTLRRDFK